MTQSTATTAATPSFKQLVKDGYIRRADAMRVPRANIFVEPGFNLREEGEELEASINALADYIFAGGQIPALEVRAVDGGVVIVDGHRRIRAIDKCIERGAPIELIDVVPFRGNDVERVARIMTSAEGRALSPLEVARGYKRLSAFNLSPEEIASKVAKTRQHVEQLLILANANSDVQAMVSKGIVSAAIAIEAVRKHGEAAGEFLIAEHDKAKAAGKTKVTTKTMHGKALPRKIVTGVVSALDEFTATLDTQDRVHITEAESGGIGTVMVDGVALAKLLKAFDGIEQERKRQEEKARQRAEKAAQAEIKEAAAS